MIETVRLQLGPYTYTLAPAPNETAPRLGVWETKGAGSSWVVTHLEAAMVVLLQAHAELLNRNRQGWALAHDLLDLRRRLVALGPHVDPPQGCYFDRDGRERIVGDHRLNNCAIAAGVPMADCQICHGVCPGATLLDDPFVERGATAPTP